MQEGIGINEKYKKKEPDRDNVGNNTQYFINNYINLYMYSRNIQVKL